MPDSLVEQCRAAREQLVQEFGGLDGLCDKLEEMDRARQQRAARPKQRPRPRVAGKSRGSRPAKRAASH